MYDSFEHGGIRVLTYAREGGQAQVERPIPFGSQTQKHLGEHQVHASAMDTRSTPHEVAFCFAGAVGGNLTHKGDQTPARLSKAEDGGLDQNLAIEAALVEPLLAMMR